MTTTTAASTRRVPWRDWDEWVRVRDALYGDGGGGVWAQKRVAAWRSRGAVPFAVEITAQLARLSSNDHGDHDHSQEVMARLALGLCVVRMVNGITEGAQRGAYAVAVTAAAARVGLPRALVDVRHAATHGALPSLAQLRAARAAAVLWLRAAYWARQSVALSCPPSLSSSGACGPSSRLVRLLAACGSSPSSSSDGGVVCARRVVRLIGCSSRAAVVDCLVPALLAGGFLVPVHSPSTTRQQHHRNVSAVCVVPDGLVALWLPVLRVFMSAWPHFAAAFVVHAVEIITKKDDSSGDGDGDDDDQEEHESENERKALTAAWARLVVESFPEAIADDTSSLHAVAGVALAACFPPSLSARWVGVVADAVIALVSPELRTKIAGLQLAVSGGRLAQLVARRHDGIAPQLPLAELEARVRNVVATGTRSPQGTAAVTPWALVQHPPCPIGLLPPDATANDLSLPEHLDDGDSGGARFAEFIDGSGGGDDDEWVPRFRQWQSMVLQRSREHHQQDDESENDDQEEEQSEDEKEEEGESKEEDTRPSKRQRREDQDSNDEEREEGEEEMMTADDDEERVSILSQLLR
jgi:hypothetical protein